MMKKTKLFILAFLLFASKLVSAQPNNNFESLISKEWKMVLYEEGGKKFPPTAKQKNDRMIFYANHSVESIENGKTDKGIWKYDSKAKILTMIDNATKHEMPMKIIKLTSAECVVEIKDSDGNVLKVNMAPVVANR